MNWNQGWPARGPGAAGGPCGRLRPSAVRGPAGPAGLCAPAGADRRGRPQAPALGPVPRLAGRRRLLLGGHVVDHRALHGRRQGPGLDGALRADPDGRRPGAVLGFRGAALSRPGARGTGRVLVFAGCLSGFEWLRGHLFTGLPWDLPGETWRAGSALSQMASDVGAYGLTWFTVAIVATPAVLALPIPRRDKGAAVLAAAAVADRLLRHGRRPAEHGAQAPPRRPGDPRRPGQTSTRRSSGSRRNLNAVSTPTSRSPPARPPSSRPSSSGRRARCPR